MLRVVSAIATCEGQSSYTGVLHARAKPAILIFLPSACPLHQHPKPRDAQGTQWHLSCRFDGDKAPRVWALLAVWEA